MLLPGSIGTSNTERTECAPDLLERILKLFGCEWSKIKGRTAFALREDGLIKGIELPAYEGGGKLLISEWVAKWFKEKKGNPVPRG